jgi:hypothetical protein
MRKALWAVVVIIMVGLALSGRLLKLNSPSEMAKLHELIRQKNEELAKSMQNQLPLKIDKVTTLNSVMAVDLTIMYSYQIDMPLELIAIDEVKKHVTENTCRDENSKRLFNWGEIKDYMYFDKNGKFIGSLKLDNTSCP